MPKSSAQIQSREETEALLRRFLGLKDFILLNESRSEGEQGPAVIAERNNMKYFFEVIGAKKDGASRTMDFKNAFCQAISRLNGKSNEKAVIAMPEVFFYNGMQARVKRFGEYAWMKIGQVFDIELWFISPQGIEESKWNEYL